MRLFCSIWFWALCSVGAGVVFHKAFVEVDASGSYFVESLQRLLSNDMFKSINTYETSFKDYLSDASADVNSKDSTDQQVTDNYYDLATDFYEYGWGQSFHFSTRFKGETFREATKRHEYLLSDHLELRMGKNVLDMGSGVGGPMRNIARYSGANVTAITINQYQTNRCRQLTRREGVDHLCTCMRADFTQTPFADATFDAVYAIESLCHLNPRAPVLNEALRVLKPGGLFFTYEWVMTDKFDKKNVQHLAVRKGIEHGGGLPEVMSASDAVQQAKDAGFEVMLHYDLVDRASAVHKKNNIPWYQPLDMNGGLSLETFTSSALGRWLTHALLVVLEKVGLSPPGSVDTSTMLRDAGDNLVLGGVQEIFTPMYVILAKKPL